eukprot:CFRG2925T1
MVQGTKKSTGFKGKSGGAARKQVGKTRPGMRIVSAKKNKHVQIRALQKKFESAKRVDIENQIAAKTSGFQKFLVVNTEEQERECEAKKADNKRGYKSKPKSEKKSAKK